MLDMTWDTCSTSWCWEVTSDCCSGNGRLGRPLLCLHQALSRGRLCKSKRLDCRLGNMSGMSSGLTLLVTGTGTGNQMDRLCARLFLWRPLSPPTRWPSLGSIAGHLGRFESLGRTELERLLRN